MKFSWTSLKISIAGAKLSHLVQDDKIWDHGSMIEHVKTVFYQLEKEKNYKTHEQLKRYMTETGYDNYRGQYQLLPLDKKKTKYSRIKDISIIEVTAATSRRPDQFIALVKGYKVKESFRGATSLNFDEMVFAFSECWCFVRLGDWWLLDSIKQKHKIF